MTGKQLLLDAIQNKPTPRPAWLPFVGSHGGKLVGVDAEQYLKSADLIVAGLLKAKELYKPDGLPIVFDLQVEAEILGCELHWSPTGPPAVGTHPLELGGSVDDLPEYSTEKGRFPIIKDALTRIKAKIGEDTALYGLITGPFTLALHLIGPNIFLQMFDEPEQVHAVLKYCEEIGKTTAKFYLDNGADVVGVVDPMTSQISSDHFEEFVTPYLNGVFDCVRSNGGYSSLFVCGDATRNLDAMAKTTCDNMSVDENIALDKLMSSAKSRGKSVGGNLKLTVVLLLGTADDSRLDAIRCMEACGTEGFILAPGCDLPFDTPAENLIAVAEMVHDDYKRQVAKATLKEATMESFEDIKLPDYSGEKTVYVDVITLNSETCAPCQYMMDAIKRAASAVSKPIQVREHRVVSRDGIGMMCRLGVANIPTICIDGEAKFVSIIPDQETLVNAIEEKIALKSN